jgi:hypothetical protein
VRLGVVEHPTRTFGSSGDINVGLASRRATSRTFRPTPLLLNVNPGW